MENLIHYGKSSINFDRFEDIQNIDWIKPIGGLWTSPINSKFGWIDWCKSEDYEFDFSKSVKLQLKDNCKILIIDSLDDLRNCILVTSKTSGNKYLDFEAISKSYDAIWLTAKGQKETHLYNVELSLDGWDCESVLILNKFCFNLI